MKSRECAAFTLENKHLPQAAIDISSWLRECQVLFQITFPHHPRTLALGLGPVSDLVRHLHSLGIHSHVRSEVTERELGSSRGNVGRAAGVGLCPALRREGCSVSFHRSAETTRPLGPQYPDQALARPSLHLRRWPLTPEQAPCLYHALWYRQPLGGLSLQLSSGLEAGGRSVALPWPSAPGGRGCLH